MDDDADEKGVAPQPNKVRFRVDPRGISREKAARRLGIDVTHFDLIEDDLYAQGFPRADPLTGMWDLKAIDAWMDARSGIGSTAATGPLNAQDVFTERLRGIRNR